MTIAEWLIETMKKLRAAGVDSPRRDALVLMEDTLRKDRAWVTSHPEHQLDVKGLSFHALEAMIERRTAREPLAYIRGKAWFYGRFFELTPDVMIPRPESEAFIELLKQLDSSKQLAVSGKQTILDVGTGSGCLAITAKLELPGFKFVATDNSEAALSVARRNAKNRNVNIKLIKGSLLEPLIARRWPLAAIMANLPYVPQGLITSPEITAEPEAALFSGEDGLDHYRRFWEQIKANSFVRPEFIFIESLENQQAELQKLAKSAGYRLMKTEVLVQVFKKH